MVDANFKQIFTGEDKFMDIVGQTLAKKEIMSALLVNRHIIIAGPPGIGKTTIAKNVAKLLPEISIKKDGKSKKLKGEDRFVRIQGSPDLTVEDLLGDIDPIKALKYGPMSVEAFTPGKIFKADNGILFFDEVNRCPEKLQNALLQVLQEGTATIGSYSVDFPANFIFIGTMNPEDSSTERLSDVFADRFDVITMDYPEKMEIETGIVKEHGEKIEEVEFSDKLIDLAILFVRMLRENKDLERKPSVRASLGLYERAQANAFLDGRKEVIAEDIADAVVSVLSHRIELKPSVKYLQSNENFLRKELKDFSEEHEEFEKGDDP